MAWLNLLDNTDRPYKTWCWAVHKWFLLGSNSLKNQTKRLAIHCISPNKSTLPYSSSPLQKHLQPFPKRQILDSSKLEDFADDNFKFDENGRQFSKWVENTAGKGEIARYEQFCPFPTVFSKDFYCRHVKTRACLGKG